MKELFNTIKLVEGTYSPTDSAGVLLSLIADKIKFHNLQILCQGDKNNTEIIHAEKRIAELKESRKMVTDLILKARNAGYNLKIDGTIKIEMLKQE